LAAFVGLDLRRYFEHGDGLVLDHDLQRVVAGFSDFQSLEDVLELKTV
jgi:hypothetical protein